VNSNGSYHLTLWEESTNTSGFLYGTAGFTNSFAPSGQTVVGQALTVSGSQNYIIFQATESFSVVYTAISGGYTDLISTTNYGGVGANYNTSSGSAPTWTFTGTMGGNGQAVLSAIAIYEQVPTCGPPVFSLLSKMYDVSLPQTTTVTSGCTYDCYAFNATPTSSSPPTCSAGTQITDGSAVTLPAGLNTLNAIGVESGFVNSAVASIPYNIQPTVASLNGVTVGNVSGNISKLNGVSLGTIAPGTLHSWNSLTTTLPNTVSTFINMSGGTNGVQPAITDLVSSTHGQAATGTWGIGGAGMTYTNAKTYKNLPQPLNIGGTIYNDSGSLGLLCTTGVSVHCGTYQNTWTTSTTSGSLGIWFQPTCAVTDCAAHGTLDGNPEDYVVVHVYTGTRSPCSGIFLEGTLGNSFVCLPYISGTLYRINAQINESAGAIAVVFTNGSAVISGTNILGVNEPIQLSTTGSLPTNFLVGNFNATGTTNGTTTLSVTSGTNIANGQLIGSSNGDIPAGTIVTNVAGTTITMSNAATGSNAGETIYFQGTTYYVISTGLGGTQFELSTYQGGPAIVAGSAGSGTQTANVVNQLTICANGSLLGNLTGIANTNSSVPYGVQIGPTGEEPNSSGPLYYYYGISVDWTGRFSSTQCIL
jgi:hypothetical protein